MNANGLARTVALLVVIPMALTAQLQQRSDRVVLQNWAAPLYWQPTQAEREASSAQAAATVSLPLGSNALVFVAMTPCRIADTIAAHGFTGAFGPPSLVGGATGRTFPIQSNATCPVPSNAQAYSFNMSVVPPAAGGYITASPTGTAMPLAATLIWGQSLLVSNAAVVPAGTNGSVDVYASANTDLVIDINGYYAAPTDLINNTALGAGALQNNTSGIDNTASGTNALENNTSGAFNTATGTNALENNTTGDQNTAIGETALENNTTGGSNTAIGFYTLRRNTTGEGNTAIGWVALGNNTTGGSNTAIGQYAMVSNQTGSNNIAVGGEAAFDAPFDASNNIHIGSTGASSDSGTIRIGNIPTRFGSPQTSFFAAGIRGTTTGNNDAVPVVIDSAGQLGTVSSSRRFKEDIQDMGDTSSGLLRLHPVTFRYKQPFNDGSKPVQYGLVAEEVAEVYPDLVAHSADGQIETVKYQVLDSMLLNELQKEHQQVQQLQTRIAALEQLLSGKVPPAAPADQ